MNRKNRSASRTKKSTSNGKIRELVLEELGEVGGGALPPCQSRCSVCVCVCNAVTSKR
ncbi:MAG TPA: hypothetical protein VFK02_05105 [Kofleriaceae bacterium]|nr:hypothetical protein [Kofleriaceae bacterium]